MVCEKDAVPKNRCHIRYLQLFSTVKYKVTLTVTNALGKNFTTLTFDEFAIGNFHGSNWPLQGGVGVGLLCKQCRPSERWGRKGTGSPSGDSACPWRQGRSHPGILPVPLSFSWPCWHLSIPGEPGRMPTGSLHAGHISGLGPCMVRPPMVQIAHGC